MRYHRVNKTKKIGLGVGISIGGIVVFFGSIFLAISIFYPNDLNNVNTSDESQKIATKLYNKSIEDLLPTIDELGLNWRLDEKVDPNTKLVEMILSEDDVESYQIESIGLLESVSQKYTKLGTPSTWKFWATVSLYKFNSTYEAIQQWNNIKDFQNKNRAFDIYDETENCRSIQESGTLNDRHTDLCYKNNILILIEYSTDVAIQYYDVQDDFELMPIIIKNINNS